MPLIAKRRDMPGAFSLFYDGVCASKQVVRQCESERCGGLQIDHLSMRVGCNTSNSERLAPINILLA
jgi:hypothetical protein